MHTTGIVAFAFGVPHTIASNKRIASVASKKARELNAPVYTQQDVRPDSDIEVCYTAEDPGSPPPTLRIARGAVRWALKHRYTTLYVVAAPPHLQRAVRDLIRAVRESKTPLVVYACEAVTRYPENSWFCPDSTQDRTRSRVAWRRRERILSCMPWCIYKHIAQ